VNYAGFVTFVLRYNLIAPKIIPDNTNNETITSKGIAVFGGGGGSGCAKPSPMANAKTENIEAAFFIVKNLNTKLKLFVKY
jgi:hypothetical protein